MKKKTTTKSKATKKGVKTQSFSNGFAGSNQQAKTQYEAAKEAAVSYAVDVIVNPEDHLDAVESTIDDFLAGFEYAQHTPKESNDFVRWIEEILLNEGPKAAITYLECLANKGNADAAYFLSKLYLEGDAVEKNVKKGVKYLQFAANFGNIHAMEEIAESYLTCANNEDDRQTAFDLYHALALKENAEAEMILSYFYMVGYGCEANEKLAYIWHLKARVDNFDETKVIEALYKSEDFNLKIIENDYEH